MGRGLESAGQWAVRVASDVDAPAPYRLEIDGDPPRRHRVADTAPVKFHPDRVRAQRTAWWRVDPGDHREERDREYARGAERDEEHQDDARQ